MLKKIIIKNVKSFRNEALLDLTCSKSNEFIEINTFNKGKNNLLKNIIIYGANSSGKSNFLNSLMLFSKILLSSYDAQSELIKDIEPFMFNLETFQGVSEFGANFIINDIEYEYSFGIKSGKVVSEELYRIIKRKVLLFKRTSPYYNDIETSKEFMVNKELLLNLREDVLFLTFTSFLNNKTSNLIKSFFNNIYFGNDNKSIPLHFIKKGEKFIEDKYLQLIKLADSNIENIMLDSNDEDKNKLFVVYKIKNLVVEAPFDKYSSSGTKHFYRILRYMLYILENGGVFIMDEIDKKLHPFLTRKIIEMFNSIEYNKGNAQLICSVHDVTLLEENLRRDQIYFIDRNNVGESELYSLSDFVGIRKNNNKLKKYLQGQFGGIPKF